MKVALITAVFVLPLVAAPAVIASATASVALAPHGAPAAPPLAAVPPGGFPNHFPFGQCTWWAAHNREVTWNGNAGDWLTSAAALGVPTSAEPSVGAIVVYRPGGHYSRFGHVAIVTATGAGAYTVSEMNAPLWGRVSTRELAWPDPDVLGFIPLTLAETR
jgi:surface antigen